MSLTAIALLLALTGTGPGGRTIVVIAAAAPLDSERLADAARAYLDSAEFDVRSAEESPTSLGDDSAFGIAAWMDGRPGDLFVVARFSDPAASSTVELQLMDARTHTRQVALVLRSGHEPDLYRTLALKLQAMLLPHAPARSTSADKAGSNAATASPPGKSAEPKRDGQTPSRDRQASTPTASAAAAPALPAQGEPAFHIEAAYHGLSFPLAGAIAHGASLGLRLSHAWYEAGLRASALQPLNVSQDAVDASIYTVPIDASFSIRGRRAPLEGGLGLVGELMLAWARPHSNSVPVKSSFVVAPALGMELVGRARVSRQVAFFARASVLGVVAGQRFLIEGNTATDLSRFHADLQAGVSLGL